jgi:hypothetical protein|tara:strand:- start:796 stop:1068 length:273 start_codon:yes stop_codon:yes gene_type:complete
MMDNWITPAIGMFLIGQVGASVWWASGTDTTIQANSAAIEKVVENEKQIAVIQVQQVEIAKDVGEIKNILLQNQDLVRQLLIQMKPVASE